MVHYLPGSFLSNIDENLVFFYNNSQYELLLKYIDKNTSILQDSPEINLLEATSYYYSGFYYQAIEFVESVLLKQKVSANPVITAGLYVIKAESCIYCKLVNECYLTLSKLTKFLNANNSFSNLEKMLFFLDRDLITSYLYRWEGKFEKSEEVLSNVIESLERLPRSKLTDNYLAFVNMQKGQLYGLERDKSRTFAYLKKSLEIFNNNTDIFGVAEVNYYLGLNFINFYDFDNASKTFKESIDLNLKLENSNKSLWALLGTAITFRKFGKLQLAKELLNKILSTTRNSKDDILDLLVFKELGNDFYFTGDIDHSLLYFQKAELGFQKLNLNNFQGLVLNKIGNLKSKQGLFDESLYYHEQALKKFNLENNQLDKARTLSYIAENDFNKGAYESAFTTFDKVKNILIELKNINGLAFVYLNLAKISLILNNQLVYTYYSKSLVLFEKLQNIEGLIESYIGFGIYQEDHDNNDEAQLYFMKAKNLIRDYNGTYIKLNERIYEFGLLSIDYSLGKGYDYVDLILDLLRFEEKTKKVAVREKFFTAFKLKLAKNIRDKAKSLDIFEEICNSELTTNFYTLILAYLNRFELIIFELKIFGTEDLFVEAKNVLEELISLTSINNFSAWSIKSLALKGELALVQLHFEETKHLFNDALRIAKLKNLNRLEMSLHNQFDEILIKIDKLSLLNKQTNSIQERLEITELSVFDSNKYYLQMESVEELPAYLSIINNNGITLYSYNFLSEKNQQNKDQLISGFIIAINSVIQQVFSSSGFLERIKHKEYTLIISNLVNSLYICYGYKGQSYQAQKRIQLISKAITKNQMINRLNTLSERNQTLNKLEAGELTEMIKEIFLNSQKAPSSTENNSNLKL